MDRWMDRWMDGLLLLLAVWQASRSNSPIRTHAKKACGEQQQQRDTTSNSAFPNSQASSVRKGNSSDGSVCSSSHSATRGPALASRLSSNKTTQHNILSTLDGFYSDSLCVTTAILPSPDLDQDFSAPETSLHTASQPSKPKYNVAGVAS